MNQPTQADLAKLVEAYNAAELQTPEVQEAAALDLMNTVEALGLIQADASWCEPFSDGGAIFGDGVLIWDDESELSFVVGPDGDITPNTGE